MIALMVGLSGCSRQNAPPGAAAIKKESAAAELSPHGYVIAAPCRGVKDAACVDVCPVDVIHPRKDEPGFAQAAMLHIDPCGCIHCGACIPACPVEAIYAPDALPERYYDDARRAYEAYGLAPGVTC
jgi:ferredoxin